jgi:hypothetical protein
MLDEAKYVIIKHMKASALRKLLDRVPNWPKAAQDELLRSMAEIETRYGNIYEVTGDDRAALHRSAEDVRKGRLAADSDVSAVFDRD